MKWTVLIVDDEPDNLQLLRQILMGNYRLLFAKNGFDALKLIEKEKPHLILLDVMMPEMSGFEVCKQLKDNHDTQHIPVVFVTALSEVGDEQAGFDLGAVDYITKPVSSAIVRSRVDTHIRLYNQKLACESKVKLRTRELEETRLKIIQRLGRAAEYKDNETGLHVVRMSHYSKIIAAGIGWDSNETEMLFQASPMHDIGKIGISDDIITKPGQLDDDQWDIMKTHPEIGAAILGEGEDGLLGMARTVALSHHEKWDGTGYPNHLSGEEIPIEGRIVAIADVFDALTTERPYKKAWSIEKASKVIADDSGKHFDPELVKVFFKYFDEVMKIKTCWAEESSRNSLLLFDKSLEVSQSPLTRDCHAPSNS